GDFATAGGAAVNNIARWDGSQWQSLGSGTDGPVRAIAIYDGDIVAAGRFFTAGGVPANFIARWDGAAWSPLGAGLTGVSQSDSVYTMLVHDGDLIVAGSFSGVPGVFGTRNIARWDGAAWHGMDGGFDRPVNALAE